MFDINQVTFLLEERLSELTEQQLEFLVENRIDFIKSANKDKISTDHDPEAASIGSDKIVDTIANKIDPTTNKSHTQWLVNQYKRGGFKLSDAKSLKKTMSHYEEHKNVLENKDIGQFKDISHLKDVMATKTLKIKSHESEVKEDAAPRNLQEIFNEGGAVGYKIPSKKSSIENYGPNGKMARTHWCTAANSTHNMFNGYQGGKYTLHLPNNEVIQLHHGSNQIKDVNDQEINVNNPRFAPHEETIRKFVEHTRSLEAGETDNRLSNRFSLTPSTEIDKAFHAHAEAVNSLSTADRHSHYRAIGNLNTAEKNLLGLIGESGKVSDEHFDKLKNLKTYTGGRYDDFDPAKIEHIDATKSLMGYSNPGLQDAHIKHLVDNHIEDHLRFSGYHTFKQLVQNKNISDDTHHALIGKIGQHITDPSSKRAAVSAYLSSANNLKPEHVERLMNIIGATTPEQQHEFIKKDISVSHSVELPDHLQKSLANDPEEMISLAKNTKLNREAKDILIRNAHSHPTLSNNIIDNHQTFNGEDLDKLFVAGVHPNTHPNSIFNHPEAKPDHIDHMIDHMLRHGVKNGHWVTSSKVSRQNLDKLFSDPAAIKTTVDQYGHSLTDNPRVKSSDLDRVIETYPESPYMAIAAAKSTVAKPKHAEHALNVAGNVHLNNALSVIDHKNITEGALHTKATDINTSPNNVNAILQHHSTGLETFKTLVAHPRHHGAITSSKNAPPSILHTLATSPMDHIRANVASHPNTEAKTLEILKNDSDPDVAKVAAKRLK